MDTFLIKLEHVEREHERLLALGITGYKDIVMQGLTPKDGYIELPRERYDVVADWKKMALAGNLGAPPTFKVRRVNPYRKQELKKDAKGCGCTRTKKPEVPKGSSSSGGTIAPGGKINGKWPWEPRN